MYEKVIEQLKQLRETSRKRPRAYWDWQISRWEQKARKAGK